MSLPGAMLPLPSAAPLAGLASPPAPAGESDGVAAGKWLLGLLGGGAGKDEEEPSHASAYEETTDPSSGVPSDAESTCSSMSSAAGGPSLLGARRRAPAALRLRGCHGFGGTPLEPIPGTPIASAPRTAPTKRFQPPPGNWGLGHGRASVPARREGETPAPPDTPPVLPSPKATAAPPPPPPSHAPDLHLLHRQEEALTVVSPSKGARGATLAKAKRESRPLKVRLPKHHGAVLSVPLNPEVPVKKRPPFPKDGDAAAAAMERLDPRTPVKKQVSAFLLEESLQFLRAPPGLLVAAC